jgi:hypothetical protein
VEHRKKNPNELRDSLWASPAIFAFVSGVLLLLPKFKGGPDTGELGWYVYFAGWGPLILMSLWCLVAQKRPPIPAAPVGLGFAVLFGAWHWIFSREFWPF